MSNVLTVVFLLLSLLSLYINCTTYYFFSKMIWHYNFLINPLFQDQNLWITPLDVKIVGIFIFISLIGAFFLPIRYILKLRWAIAPPIVALFFLSPVFTLSKAISASTVYLSSIFMLFSF